MIRFHVLRNRRVARRLSIALALAATATALALAPPAVATTPRQQQTIELRVWLDRQETWITNRSSVAIDMTGWRLLSTRGREDFVFPEMVLEPGASCTVGHGLRARHSPPEFVRWRDTGIWDQHGDAAELYDANGRLVARTTRAGTPASVTPDVVVGATDARDPWRAGREAFAQQRYDEMARFMNDAASRLDDTEENAYALGYIYAFLGRAYLEQQMFAEASQAYLRWARYHPDQADSYAELARARNAVGDLAGAADYFRAASERAPSNAALHFNLGAVLLNLGDEAGISELEKAVELQPDYALAHRALGYVYAGIGDNPKAVEHLRRYLEINPDAPDAADVQQLIEEIG